jgi:hypothetical protein
LGIIEEIALKMLREGTKDQADKRKEAQKGKHTVRGHDAVVRETRTTQRREKFND